MVEESGRAGSASDGDEKDGVGACVDKVHSLTVDDKWFYIKPEHLCLRGLLRRCGSLYIYQQLLGSTGQKVSSPSCSCSSPVSYH